MPTRPRPTLLFGAFDRHNFGDLLFPHLVGALLPAGTVAHAGLAERDLRPFGGHRVAAVASASPPAAVIHAGGELLSCTAWEAAVMVAEGEVARQAVADLDRHPGKAAAWAVQRLGRSDRAPYVLGQGDAVPEVPRIFNAVGGVALGERPAPFSAEVVGKLADAAHVGVRDRVTRDFLAARGIAATLAPDPAVLTAELFAPLISERNLGEPMAAVRRAFPEGYLAFQCSADFGDDATLDLLADQLRQLPAGLGIAAFCAGTAPWHDDPQVYRRLLARLAPHPALIFASLHLWDICALLAQARAYAGSSLHGRIVAGAFAVPAVSLIRPGQGAGKVPAYLDTWEPGSAPVAPADLLPALEAALAASPARRREQAAGLATAYRAYAAEWIRAVPPPPGRGDGRKPGICPRRG